MSGMSMTSQATSGRAEKVDRRASEFILKRYDRPDWTEADQADLEAWLEESLAHRAAYWRLKAAWQRADRLNALRPSTSRNGAATRSLSANVGTKVATALICATALAASYWFASRPGVQTFSTGIGERRNLTLGDGSKIELTTNTILRLETDGQHRMAWLDKGEAYFQIVHDQTRPFVLHSANMRIVDLGTEFAARREKGGIQVTVVHGSVGIAPETRLPTQPVRLVPGDAAFASANSISVTKRSSSEISDALSWRQGILIFRHTPLSQVVIEFNRYNRKTLHLADPSIAGMTISANLPATDVQVFARMAQNFLGLHVEQHGDNIELSDARHSSRTDRR